MTQKISAPSEHAGPGAPPRIDVLIITALKEEYDAVLDVGAGSGSIWTNEPSSMGLEVAIRTFRTSQGGHLRVGVTQAPDMGSDATAMLAPLVEAYSPQCLAMCGVCAGRKGAVELGDVIIADAVWNYESGKLEAERGESGERVERSKGRATTYPFDTVWRQRAERFKPDGASPWLLKRPRPFSAQKDWLLNCLLQGTNPANHEQRKERCANYPEVLDLLLEEGLIHKGVLKLTKKGARYIQQRKAKHPDGLPEPKDFRVHVGPLATGSKVMKDPEVFERLSTLNYKVLGVEMEGAAIGALAHRYKLPYWLVMKGVMDFADLEKNDHFKPFAAQASAECLLAFLREHLPATSETPRQKQPDAHAREEALAQYKRACAKDPGIRCLDLRGLVGIAPGKHQTELDLLDFAVVPALYDAREDEGSRTAMIRQELSARDLEPARRQELQAELIRLERAQWSHQGGHSRWASTFAAALQHYRRLVIIGDPGAGKSVLTRLVVLACMDGEAGDRARHLLLDMEDRFTHDTVEAVMSLSKLLPVRLTLGTLGRAIGEQGLSVEDCIRQELHQHRAPDALIDGLGELLQEGQLFLILDGLDEVPSRQRERVVDAVRAFDKSYPKVRILATTRPHGYNPRIQSFDYTRLAPLHEGQQQALVSRLHHLVETHRRGDERDVERARHRTRALLRAIHERHDWQELTSNPLLLTLCALTRTDTKGFPKHRVFLFENFLRTILVQWREVVPPEAEKQLLRAWSAVASKLVVQEEQLRGVMEGHLLDLLDDALGRDPSPALVDAETALDLAVETGLVRRDEETVGFWHATFGEFLAARHLTRTKKGSAKRLLKVNPLPPLVLRFAAARLDHVLMARKEVDALARGLLARDEAGAGRLLHPGLRAVSSCMMDGVSFSPEFVQRVWSTWVGLLDSTPPCPLWGDFAQLTERAPRPHLPEDLVEKLARLDDQGVHEVRLGRARLVAPAAALKPAAREACEQWLDARGEDTLRLYGAYGLASAGDWARDEVIDVLGRFSTTHELPPGDVGGLVHRAPPEALGRLRALVHIEERPGEASPMEGHRGDDKQEDLRISAACLLAVGGAWDDNVARVLKRTLACTPRMHREKEARDVVRACAAARPVQEALLDWASDDSTLGRFAREILGDVAPLLKELPVVMLERSLHMSGRPRQELESLLVATSKERPAFTQTLQGWLALRKEEQERRICAARLLLQIVPRDEQLHEALRWGLRANDASARVQWALLALGVSDELTDAALATLQDCARSPEHALRKRVYEGIHKSRLHLGKEVLDEWLAIASERGLPAAARLDAMDFVAGAQEGLMQQLEPLARELLDVEDPAVRRGALTHLSLLGKLDLRAAILAAEDAARTGDERAFRVVNRFKPFLPEVLQAFLYALPSEALPKDKDENLQFGVRHFANLAAISPPCVELLLETLKHPGPAGMTSWKMLFYMRLEHSPVRAAIQKRLEHAAKNPSQLALRRLVDLGLDHKELALAAVEASRTIEFQKLPQKQLAWLAARMAPHAAETSIRMWRLVLDGDAPELVLEAVAKLLRHCPGEARAWIQPAIARLLGSPETMDRLDAADLALTCGFLKDEACTALIGCLDSTDAGYDRDWSTSAALHNLRLRSPPNLSEEATSMNRHFHVGWRRLDFMAMHALYRHQPGLCLQRLALWLDDEEWERFECAVGVLATRDGYREGVRVALEHRLSTAPAHRLKPLVELIEEHGFFSTQMAEPVLARYHVRLPELDDVELCLVSWMHQRPEEIWTLLRRDPARRDAAARLMQFNVPVIRDSVAFAVEFAFEHASYWTVQERLLEQWSKPSDAESEKLKGWLREELDRRAAPNGFDDIFLFDHLAESAEMPRERRIEVLRRALAIAIPACDSEEESRSHALYQQARAGLRLLDLGCRDERIPTILEAAAYECRALYNSDRFELVRALLSLRSADEPLRRFVVNWVIRPFLLSDLDEELEVLEGQLLLSSSELTEVLSARLLSYSLEEPFESLAIFETLERLGCERERRAAILLDFVSRCGAKLKSSTRLALAERAELSKSDAAKLMLHVIAQKGRDMREAAPSWLKLLASRQSDTDKDLRWRLDTTSSYLSLRLDALARLSEVDEPTWLEQLLAEVADGPAATLPGLCRRVRGDGAPLTDADWVELVARITVTPGDGDTTRLAKEWLTLRLWQIAEPLKVNAVLQS